ncbi:MAG: pilus assembly protein [Alcaligenaceae bacterium]|nr:pilus assembly protein [Alcaligenaceae bacterium]
MHAARALLRARRRPAARAGRVRWLSRGVAALEFAIVSPLVILVIFFSLEIGIALWADATLEVAASRVSRLGQLGVEGDCTTEVRKVLEDTMGPWVTSMDELKIDVRLYHPGEPAEDVDWSAPVCNAGDRGDMVIYHIAFDRPSFTGILSWLDIPLLEFRRTVLIQNEP